MIEYSYSYRERVFNWALLWSRRHQYFSGRGYPWAT